MSVTEEKTSLNSLDLIVLYVYIVVIYANVKVENYLLDVIFFGCVKIKWFFFRTYVTIYFTPLQTKQN